MGSLMRFLPRFLSRCHLVGVERAIKAAGEIAPEHGPLRGGIIHRITLALHLGKPRQHEGG